MTRSFENRDQAGRELGERLKETLDDGDFLVLGLPRGGLPVASRVADALGADLDLMLVRKLGMPGHEELAMGAIATGGARVINEEVVGMQPAAEGAIERVTETEKAELERRERAYRGDRPLPTMRDRTLILVDDGMATGATMRAAVLGARQHEPAAVVVAVPVAPPDSVARLRDETDGVVCLETPEPFMGVGRWYRDFRQTSDEEVRLILDHHWRAA